MKHFKTAYIASEQRVSGCKLGQWG